MSDDNGSNDGWDSSDSQPTELDDNGAELLLGELNVFCRSDSISEEGLREIISRHELTPNNNLGINDYKFFLSACDNKSVNEGIIRCILEYFPQAINATDDEGWVPLHVACNSKNVTLSMIQLLLDAAPQSVRRGDDVGDMPLHILCANPDVDEKEAIKILKLLLEQCPESVRHANDFGYLPVHYASGTTSHAFCRVLIEAYPGSERISTNDDIMPLHLACMKNTLATVEYFYNLEPDAVNAETVGNRKYPIHLAIMSLFQTNAPENSLDVVQFLLDCDPNVKLQKLDGDSLLHVACLQDYDDSNIDAALQIIKTIYDAHPEAIEDNRLVPNIQHFRQQVQAFINGELVHVRQARDHRLMTTPDENGQLPLHHAVRNNVTLASIKLLLKGNPSAIRCADNNGALPLHLACQHHDSPKVIQHLLDIHATSLATPNREGNTALHYACRGANYDIIATLLKAYDDVPVSKRNAQGKLPLHLLWESNAVEDRESVDYSYLDSVFLLLKAYPETIMNFNVNMKQNMNAGASRNGKKRKLGAV